MTRSIIIASFFFASQALAQVGVFIPGDTECRQIEVDCTSDVECTDVFEVPSACRSIDAGGVTFMACVPDESAFCCAFDGTPLCPDGTTCHLASPDAAGVCLRNDRDYCEANPMAERIQQCHTSPDFVFPVGFELGDCDGDGLANAAEERAGTDHCTAPPTPIAAWVEGTADIQCATGVVACDPSVGPGCNGGAFEGVCQLDDRTGDAAPLCAPEPDLFCCGGPSGFACPALTCVLPSDREGAPGVCTNSAFVCSTDEATLRACHTSIDGLIPVPIEIGDCDGDDIENARDDAPCGEEAIDAGRPAIEPRFQGGGGCACRASPAHAGAPFLLVALAFLLRRR